MKQPTYQEEEPEYYATVKVFEILKDGTKGQQLLVRRYRFGNGEGAYSLAKDFEGNGFIAEVEEH